MVINLKAVSFLIHIMVLHRLKMQLLCHLIVIPMLDPDINAFCCTYFDNI